MIEEKKRKAIIVDEHPLMAQATIELLSQIGNIDVVGVSKSYNQSISEIQQWQPDLLIMDYRKDITSNILTEIREGCPNLKIIIFTGIPIDQIAPEVFMQANGVVSKEENHESVKHAFLCVMNGYYIVPRLVQKQLSFTGRFVDVELSEEEVAIMDLILKGCTLNKIAEQVFLSKRSVDNYQKRIFQKMGVGNRTQAIELFMRSRYYRK